jgi:acyl-CoA reductase-like NAD-dependent aldehyde dehydrogenase
MAQPKVRPAQESFEVRSPVDGTVLGTVPVTPPAEVHEEIARAHRAQERWAALSVKERGRRLRRWRDVIVEHTDELTELISRENGKTRQEALVSEILPFSDMVSQFTRRGEKILSPRKIDMHLIKHKRSYLHYTPRGVVGIISPWNFPFMISLSETFMALLAGNGVVLKPSEVTPLISLKAKELYDRSGLDPDLFRVVTGYGPTGAALVDGDVQLVVFTGSVAVGKKIAARCGERLIPCIMELGGKAPFIVCEDADVERAARAAVWGGFMNAGQVCASVERVYVHRSIAEAFTRRVVELTRELRHGDPTGFDVDTGAVTFEPQVKTAEAQIADAVAKGAEVAAGGNRVEPVPGGRYFEPTVLTGVTHEMDVAREETFGPLLPILVVENDEQALELANDSHLGLTGYVFSKDLGRAQALAERLRVGTAMVNDVLYSYGAPETPWMGLKESGFGKVHSDDGLRAMCEERHVTMPQWWAPAMKRELWWHPYGRKTYDLLNKAIRTLKRL